MIIEKKSVNADIYDKLETLTNCISNDTTRPMLTFVKLHVEKGEKRLIATDGRCMAIYNVTHTRIVEFQAAKRCRMYRVINIGKGKIIMDDCTASCAVTFPAWQKVFPNMDEYIAIDTLGEKTHSQRYTKLLYSLCSNKKMPISLELFDKTKKLLEPAKLYVHKEEKGRAVVLTWGKDFLFIAMPYTIDRAKTISETETSIDKNTAVALVGGVA